MSKADPPEREPPASMPGAVLRIVLRLAVIGGVALAAHSLIGLAMDLAGRLPPAGADAMIAGLLLSALLVYAVLIAIPFVPGIEIGLALLLLRGADIALPVYVATLLGLALAFAIGRLLPEASVIRLLADLRLRRAAGLVAEYTALPQEARVAHLYANLPRWIALPLTRYRYGALAVLLNLPGNVLLGGGGGLMLMAGLSRLFSARLTLATMSVAILPVPLIIWLLGPGLLS